MNEILPYRAQPLSESEFKQIAAHVKKYFVLKERLVGKSVPKRDSDGEIYAWEHDLVSEGFELTKLGNPPPQLIDAMERPATIDAVRKHILTLSAMKRYTGGDGGLAVIIGELIRHLDGCSEYAIKQICDVLALDTVSPFFPDPAQIVASVKSLQSQICANRERPPQKEHVRAEAPPADPLPRPDFKQKRRVARVCKLMFSAKTKWEKKFMAAYPRHMKGT